jgi:predicted deacetylase
MHARYLLRFDDFCPTMNWAMWRAIEDILIDAHINPILAVIPANQDSKLHIQPPNKMFWDEVRNWQSRGWTIGLHGYRHLYDSDDSGLIGKNRYSEFAGVCREEQTNRIIRALAIFHQEGVWPDLWVAPAHSFDQTTLALLRDHDVGVVSDGLFLYPGLDRQGTFWIPQQLSDFKSASFGIWTICLHPNWWTSAHLTGFKKDVEHYRDRIVSCHDVLRQYATRHLDWQDAITSKFLRAKREMRRTARQWWPRRDSVPVRAMS